MKFLKKYWFKIVGLVLIVLLIVFFIFNNAFKIDFLSQESDKINIISVYHIETFEGGGKSRLSYLKEVAKEIEKENKNVLFIFKQINPENLQTELETNQPDIISFGYGVGKIVLPYLNKLEYGFNLREELLDSGCFNNSLYAVAYISSGYCTFNQTDKNDCFIYGVNNYINPKLACNKETDQKLTQYEAYKQFVYNKDTTLFGTARDLFRIDNLNKTNRISSSFSPCDTYTDLIQYLGIVNKNDITLKFLQLSLSNEYQNKLKDYYLFNVTYDRLYYSGIYSDMEMAIKKCKIGNVFNG